MNIAVIGTGYVGLVTGVCFAEIGNTVTCVDIDERKIAALREGHSPIYEQGIEDLLRQNSARGRLHFTTDMADVAHAAVVFLALPTPPQEDGSADLRAVLTVAEALPDFLGEQFVVVVNKSTVPVGTADEVRQVIMKKRANNVAVVSNPEFLREGIAVRDFMEPDRVVLGVSDERAELVMRELYAPLTDELHPLLVMDERSAELTKYAANAFLATKISFINEVANLAERVGANVEEVARAIGADTRIGARFLQAGIGYGGSCFPKDVLALDRTAQAHDYEFRILRAVLEANQAQQARLVEKVQTHYGDLHGKTFALWGLAFKPDTDDIRESPALKIIDTLIAAGATVRAYDPEAAANVARHFADKHQATLVLVDTPEEALEGAHALLIATEWKVFRNADPQVFAQLQDAVIFDGRNIFEPHVMREAGFTYYSIGRAV